MKGRGSIDVRRRREIRREQLLFDFKEKRRHWNLKEKTLDHTVWRNRLERSCGPFPKTYCGTRECKQCCQDTTLSQSYQLVNSLISFHIWLLVGGT